MIREVTISFSDPFRLFATEGLEMDDVAARADNIAHPNRVRAVWARHSARRRLRAKLYLKGRNRTKE